MTSLKKFDAYRMLQASGLPIFTHHDIQRLCNISNENTAYKLLQRLEQGKVIRRVKSGAYQLIDAQTHDFTIANALRTPSYVSLESALSRYGILSQFPFVITSVTSTRNITIENDKTYEYAHIAPSLFDGYIKENDYLIATPEKALFDGLYFMSKGLRTLPIDELDLSPIQKKVFSIYYQKTPIKKFEHFLRSKHIL